jgi:hypothetical protein
MAARLGEHPALGFHRWLCARGVNDALHGREAWRRPGKRDRGCRREVGSQVSAHHGPGSDSDSVNPGSNPGPSATRWKPSFSRCPQHLSRRNPVKPAAAARTHRRQRVVEQLSGAPDGFRPTFARRPSKLPVIAGSITNGGPPWSQGSPPRFTSRPLM